MAATSKMDRTRTMLETLAAEMPTIIFDRERLTEEGVDELNRIRAIKRDVELMIMPLPLERLREMFVFVPPDQLARYEAGFPLLIAPVFRDEHDKNPRHRPDDTPIVKSAKNALEVEAFRLTGRQKVVELAGNTRRLNLTPAAAEDRAKAFVAEAVWRGGRDPNDENKKGRLAGLIDRGRRLAARFFGTQKPIDRWRTEARDVEELVRAEGRTILPALQADNRERASGMSWNEDWARTFSGAMSQWNVSVLTDQPVSLADGNDVTNSIEPRMTAPALMKVAISGDFNPSTVHKNLLLEQTKFEVGALLGRLDRGRTIKMGPEHAAILLCAITTVQREECQTQTDTCDWLLVEAAAKRGDLAFWRPVLEKVITTGAPEAVVPKNSAAVQEN